MAEDLFNKAAWRDQETDGFDVERRDRVVTDYFIRLQDQEFDAADLLATLEAVQDGDVITRFTTEQTKVLKALGVLVHEGNSRWAYGAELGPNGPTLIDILEEAIFSE